MCLLKTRTEGGVLTIEIARADRGNALNLDLQHEMRALWDAFEDDDAARVAVLHGAPNVFSIGHDVAELASNPAISPVPEQTFYPLHLSKPVIAAIEGPCYGLGFELALACDLRVAGHGAMFGLADPHLHVPFRVASVLLPRMLCLGSSLEFIEAGRVCAAEEMRSLGLVSELTAQGEAAARASGMAHDLVQRFGAGCDYRKQAIWELSGVPLPAAMHRARTLR